MPKHYTVGFVMFGASVSLLICLAWALVASLGDRPWANVILALGAFVFAAPMLAVIGRFINERTE